MVLLVHSVRVGISLVCIKMEKKKGSTEIRTRILRFRVSGANHYTIEPVGDVLVGILYARLSLVLSWSPKSVLLGTMHPATYLQDGMVGH